MRIVGERGEYIVGDALGSGGMATVYRAERAGKGGGRVAIKRLHPHLLVDRSIVRRFRAEAKIAKQLSHPNIVEVVELVEDEAGPALVLELVDGAALDALAYAAWNREAPTPVGVVSAIGIAVLEALARAHAFVDDGGEPSPIVHRDVSPHNVLMGRDGSIKLSDFGIARIGSEAGSTAQGQLKGKVAYMAPEQLGGKTIDSRTDLYACGVMLWELLAGRRLFEGDVAEIVGSVLTGEREAPSAHAEGLDPALDAVILRALEKNPQKRFGSARIMADALAVAAPPADRDAVRAWVTRYVDQIAAPSAGGDAPPSSALPTRYIEAKRLEPRARSRVGWITAVVVVASGGASIAAWQLGRGPMAEQALTAERSSPSSGDGAPSSAPPADPTPIASEVAPPATAATSASSSSARAGAGALPKFNRNKADAALKAAVARANACSDVAERQPYGVYWHPSGRIEVGPAGVKQSRCAMDQLAKATIGPFSGKMVIQNVWVGPAASPTPR